MPLGIVNFSFDLFAPWREQVRWRELRNENATQPPAVADAADSLDRSDEEEARGHVTFLGMFPVL